MVKVGAYNYLHSRHMPDFPFSVLRGKENLPKLKVHNDNSSGFATKLNC